MKDTILLAESQPYVVNFQARQITILNGTGKEVYIRIGGLDSPTKERAQIVVPALTFFSTAIPDTTQFGFTLSDSVAPSGIGTTPIITFSNVPEPVAFSSVNLPQTSFRPALLGLGGTLNAGASSSFAMPAGLTKALVFAVWGSARTTLGTEIDCRVQINASGVFQELHRVRQGPGTAPMAITLPPLIFPPQGLLYTTVTSLRVLNSGAQPLEVETKVLAALFA